MAPDTDALLAPTLGGFEAFTQLRSDRSPEAQAYRFDLPAGATLRSLADGGAEVVLAGRRVARVLAPRATDAQGTDVPVASEVDGDRLKLTIRHREKDYAMPILVDPIAEDYWNAGHAWYDGYGLDLLQSDWFYFEDPPGGLVPRTQCDPQVSGSCYGSGHGLQIYAAPKTYSTWHWGEWLYTTPPDRTTYITDVFFTLWHNRHGDPSGYTDVVPFLFSPRAGNFTGYNVLPDHFVSTYSAVHWGDGAGVSDDGQGTKYAGTSLRVAPGTRTDWADLYAGYAAVYLDDPEPPTITGLSHSVSTSKWYGADQQVTTTATATDPGLGPKYFNFFKSLSPLDVDQKVRDCLGTRSSPCGTDWTQQLEYNTTQLQEGANTLQLAAYDATVHQSEVRSWPLKVDRSKPDVTLSGELWDWSQQDGPTTEDGGPSGIIPPIPSGSYALHVDASDGSAAAPRSGVKSISVAVDGE